MCLSNRQSSFTEMFVALILRKRLMINVNVSLQHDMVEVHLYICFNTNSLFVFTLPLFSSFPIN